ncbi:ribonuclease G [Clostridium cavendishii DSM 21758]|uniref:Ribonuclease G n=1 Tax=Clostridium cavendishii DSM 21758 TaxID=1121302 RepID=A0A1M6BJ85_9CLOT|nr:Rne/Rng family ribonuclease [Clostridium cavendishii]SHI48543.1 ribonuclease G [Clostridium cavendishii DSM 21758]
MREIYIEKRNDLRRIAIKEVNILTECFIEEETFEPIPGEIYKGIIKNIVPGIKSAFVDIGHKNNAYMSLSESELKILKKGSEVLVEVVKEELNGKGAKVIKTFSIPGKYVVLETANTKRVFSRKIKNQEVIKTLKEVIKTPEGIGITFRTNSQFAKHEDIQEEIDRLYKEYERIVRDFKYSIRPCKLFGESSIIYKVLRDNINSKTSKIIVDSKEDYEICKEYLKEINTVDLEFYGEARTLFDFYGIEKEILSLRNNKVNLKCGGYIIIEKTEAMYVIDVNSGKHVTGRNIEKTAEETNVEAAKEIARQVKLRNLAGIIVVDFIDMKKKESKECVIKALNSSFIGDRNKSKIFDFTELNLIQISRMRKGKSIYEHIEEECPLCKGHGKRLKLSYIYLLIKNEILKSNVEGKIKDFHIEINEEYKEAVNGNMFEFIKEIGALDLNIYLNFKDFSEYYKVEALLFNNQIDNVKEYLVKVIEKY